MKIKADLNNVRFIGNGVYDVIARECGLQKLDGDQAGIAFRMRLQATESFIERGATVPPCSNLVGQVTWLITQKKLASRNDGMVRRSA